MNTVKREGGFETFLFGPDSSKNGNGRKNSVVPLPTHDSNDTSSSSGGTGTWNRVGESSVVMDGGYNVRKGADEEGVRDVDVDVDADLVSQDVNHTGHEGNISGIKGSVDSLSECAEDSVMVSSDGSDAYASAASLSQYDVTDIQGQEIDYAAILRSDEEHDYMHPVQGPFSGPRRAVRFSESVEDNWEDICVDVTPFTTLSLPSHAEDEQHAIEEVTIAEDTVIPRPDPLSQSRQESFMMRQSDYAEVQRKAGIAEKAAADKAAALLASTAAAELVFCEAMSTTLSSGDSPVETESEKVFMTYTMTHSTCVYSVHPFYLVNGDMKCGEEEDSSMHIYACVCVFT